MGTEVWVGWESCALDIELNIYEWGGQDRTGHSVNCSQLFWLWSNGKRNQFVSLSVWQSVWLFEDRTFDNEDTRYVLAHFIATNSIVADQRRTHLKMLNWIWRQPLPKSAYILDTLTGPALIWNFFIFPFLYTFFTACVKNTLRLIYARQMCHRM